MLKIFLADDHPIFRRGVKELIEEAPDMIVAGEAANGREALRKVSTGDYDLVLLDITMPRQNGVEVLAELKRERPTLPVLMLSMHPEQQYALRALRAGASGYLTKECAPEELVKAIRKVSRGGKYVSATLAEHLVCVAQGDSDGLPHETLSPRQYQLLCMIAAGKTVSEVAAELSLSPRTFWTYRRRLLKKMNMESNAELIRYAVKNQLVE